ncbi:MAG: hypothetical protein V3T30_06130, partial [Thermodesulfobacteriota bacterium]
MTLFKAMDNPHIPLKARPQRNYFFLGLLVALFLIFISVQIIDDNFSDLRGEDNSSYVLLAKSIATGQGYSDINLPGAPPHTHYPPVFSLILSPVVHYFGYNFMWMRIIVIFCGLLSFYFVARFFYGLAPPGLPWLGILIALLVGTNYAILFFMGEILTELPYLLFSLIALLAFERYIYQDSFKGALYLIPFLSPLLYLTKSIGIALSVAVFLMLLLRVKNESGDRRTYIKRLGYFLIAGIAPFFIWTVRNSFYSTGISNYQSIFFQSDYYNLEAGAAGAGGFLARALTNLSYYKRAIPESLSGNLGFIPPTVFKAVMLAVLIVVAVGFLYELFRKRELKDFYVLICLLVFTFWPTYGLGAARRYALPLIPFFYYYFFMGLGVIVSTKEYLQNDWQLRYSWVALAALFVLLCCNLFQIRSSFMPASAASRVERSVEVFNENRDKRIDSVKLEKMTNATFKKVVPCYDSYLTAAMLIKTAS